MKIKMERGESVKYFAEKFSNEEPVIIVQGGAIPYIWIGGQNGPCYAVLSGDAKLKKLAESILTQLKDSK